jgi:hypothetical protein
VDPASLSRPRRGSVKSRHCALRGVLLFFSSSAAFSSLFRSTVFWEAFVRTTQSLPVHLYKLLILFFSRFSLKMLFKSIVSAAVFAVAAVAQIQFTNTPTAVAVGSTYQLTWTGGDSTAPVTIILREGSSTNLGTVTTLTTTGTGGSYSWQPDATLSNAPDYAFEIVQGSEINYSKQFSLTGGSDTPVSVVSSAAAVVSSTISASASAASSSASASASSESSSSASAAASSSSAAASSSASATQSASSTKASTSATSVPASGASGLQSPMAFILCAVAGMLYFN